MTALLSTIFYAWKYLKYDCWSKPMSDITLQEKLQRAYHDMLENVEDMVEKEGKSIREAFYKAEDKLGEWEQLSKEEVQKVSDEVKRDLVSLGETLEGAKAAFREQIQFDKRYLAEATWHKLSSIADKSTVQLIQLQKTLEENVREITREEHDSKRHQHQHWHSDHALWLDDVAKWERTHTEATEKLAEIQYVLDQQVIALEEHKQSILAHEAIAQQHEHRMEDAERDPMNQRIKEQELHDNVLHVEEKALHQQQEDFHHRMKRYHLKTMILLNTLHKETQKFG